LTARTALREQFIELLEPLVGGLGYELVDVEWAAGARDATLRIYIDLPAADGIRPARHIGVEDCEQVSREVSALLDVEDPVPGKYSLEVSSPGFDRVLRTPGHFRRFVGSQVRVELTVARDGRRRYTGQLSAVDDAGIELEVEQLPVRLRFAEITKARLVV